MKERKKSQNCLHYLFYVPYFVCESILIHSFPNYIMNSHENFVTHSHFDKISIPPKKNMWRVNRQYILQSSENFPLSKTTTHTEEKQILNFCTCTVKKIKTWYIHHPNHLVSDLLKPRLLTFAIFAIPQLLGVCFGLV